MTREDENNLILNNWRAIRARRTRSIHEVRRIAPLLLSIHGWETRSELECSLQLLTTGLYGRAPMIEFARMTRRMNRVAWLFNTAVAEGFQVHDSDARRIWRALSDADKAKAHELCEQALAQMIEHFGEDPAEKK